MKPHHTLRIAVLAAMAALPMLIACQEKPRLLGITGYNYTSRYIDTFSVNSQGGTNLSANTNGSGEACCIGIRPDVDLPAEIHVEWTYGAKWDFDKGIKLQEAETKVSNVQLKGPIPKNPKIFVVHFYPNNTVEVEVSEDYPKPRVAPTIDQAEKK